MDRLFDLVADSKGRTPGRTETLQHQLRQSMVVGAQPISPGCSDLHKGADMPRELSCSEVVITVSEGEKRTESCYDSLIRSTLMDSPC